ncbi:carboxylating nicotinate-nucleotide diphosphorylase [Nocardioides yefusunii]|uniref:nicotinate-nucleotide diphosphorylase (carboxylating) n=1 Tax=Nocardioides yefusunii TaxID=2500546 RepID=A0ABW1R012_9ACTN|nr:carboxylating nicotinate-nucleotide diphosphorylase [Nocardioides yefusunii]
MTQHSHGGAPSAGTHAAASRLPSFADTSALGADLRAELEAAGLDPEAQLRHIRVALEEDLPLDAALGAAAGLDTTSVATLGEAQTAVAHFNAREPGVVSGLGVAALVFAEVMGDTVTISHRVADGTRVAAGDRVMTVAGPVRGLLTAERTALNFASHLSAVSTATSHWVDALEGTKAKVLDTRKTLPGWRALQKYAVRMGGGVNHRFSLSDMAMVKDNHVAAAGGHVPALEAVRRTFPGLPVEVEVDTLDALRDLLEVGVERVLLDNMSTDAMREAVEIAAGRTVLEASGGLTLERAREVAETGVDFISVGALTHSVVVFDLGLDLQED